MTQTTIAIDDPRVNELLDLWHENGRTSFERNYENLNYDGPSYAKTAKDRTRYIALDEGTSGVFLVCKRTGDVFNIKGYGRPNRKIDTLDGLIAHYREANENNRRIFGHGTRG